MPPVDNILIYRLGSLGDMVVALPCFHLIRNLYPENRIVMLTNEPVSGKAAPAMAILENSGLCDGCVSYPVGTRDPVKLLIVRQTIRRMQPRMLVNLAAARGRLKSLRDHLFFRSCGVRNTVGTPWQSRELQAQQMADGSFEPESQRLASRISSLGAVNLADRRFWDLRLTSAERNQAMQLMPQEQQNAVAVSVGTKVPAKDWGEENWAGLLTLLSQELPESALVLLGSADERARSEHLSRRWAGPAINLCGATSPRVSAAVLQRCRMFIGHDSGPMHLASAVGTPTLGLFSWLNPPGQWFPGHRSWEFVKVLYPTLPDGVWKPKLQLKRSDSEGIGRLHPADVLRAAMELWRDNKMTNDEILMTKIP